MDAILAWISLGIVIAFLVTVSAAGLLVQPMQVLVPVYYSKSPP